MEANDKNLRMFTYQTHDYMDKYPKISFTQEWLDEYNKLLNNENN